MLTSSYQCNIWVHISVIWTSSYQCNVNKFIWVCNLNNSWMVKNNEKMRWIATPRTRFWLSYVVFLSSAWKNGGMTILFFSFFNLILRTNFVESVQIFYPREMSWRAQSLKTVTHPHGGFWEESSCSAPKKSSAMIYFILFYFNNTIIPFLILKKGNLVVCLWQIIN